MKKSFNKYLILGSIALLMFTQSCIETDELATPNVAAPVLILLEGDSFSANAQVSVASKFFELDKTNILDHTQGIDSIPVPNLMVSVIINNIEEVASLETNSDGLAELNISWTELGLSEPTPGNQVRLEFVGTYKNVAFRKYHTVRVN